MVATFVFGLLPVVGNLITNTLIFVMGPVDLAAGGGGGARVPDRHSQARILPECADHRRADQRAGVGELLIAMLFMEAVFGAPGLDRRARFTTRTSNAS